MTEVCITGLTQVSHKSIPLLGIFFVIN